MRKLSLNPTAPTYAPAQAPNPEHPKTYPSECLRRERDRRPRELRTLWEPKHEPIPEGAFRSREMVNLHKVLQSRDELRVHAAWAAWVGRDRARPCFLQNAKFSVDCSKALEVLPPGDRPANMRQWTDPSGGPDRSTRILRSLLDYPSRGDLRV
ncbi:hypothetical protein IscW_ISCW010506 [Ixodes scapularis]|uniref:Uncharacterized protein n=1 Tax=Ixodes scapularis TaxID=6945 RepID=B7Q8N0_IXOSC|nr:hypothetical protein IscW_ISCW010506 [Ixodes scapularis]|eukprot:XP_002405321.1 hypothetical protein IscW_ISCW010506 [Ixodes scapularis]